MSTFASSERKAAIKAELDDLYRIEAAARELIHASDATRVHAWARLEAALVAYTKGASEAQS